MLRTVKKIKKVFFYSSQILAAFVVLGGLFFAFRFQARAVLYTANNLLGANDETGSPEFNNGYTSGGGINAQGFFTNRDVVIDKTNHRLFSLDQSNSRVLVFSLDSSDNVSTTTASYVLGQHSFYSSTLATTRNGFKFPTGLALDEAGQRLFVSDTGNNRILVYNVSPGTISNYENADYVLGQTDFTSSNSTTTQSGLNSPWSLAYDPTSNRLFVSDNGNRRVLVYNAASGSIANGQNADYVIGQSNFTATVVTSTQQSLRGPRGLAYEDSTRRLFVSDPDNFRVLVFNVATSTISNGLNASNVLGQANFTTRVTGFDNTTKRKATFNTNLALDSQNNRLFVTDTSDNRILVFDSATGTIANNEDAVHVLGQTDYSGQSSAVTQSTFTSPEGLFYNSANKHLYVSDGGNARVVIFDVDTGVISDGQNALSLLGRVDGSGNIIWNYTGSTSGQNNNPNRRGFSVPNGMAVDSTSHRLFVADSGNNRILMFNLTASNTIDSTQIFAAYVLGQANFASNTPTTTINGLRRPTSLAYDSANTRLFVTDSQNNRVLVFNVSTSSMANNKNADHVLGQSGFTSSTANTTQNGFDEPGGLAYDPVSSRLFVQDFGNSRVLVYNVATSTISDNELASNVLGQANFLGSSSDLTRKGFESNYEGTGMAYDSSHARLFVGDSDNARVLVFNAATSTIADNEDADYVLGEPDFTTANFDTDQVSLCAATGISYDSAHERLFVGDECNTRVMVFNVDPSVISSGEQAANLLLESSYLNEQDAAGINTTLNLSSSQVRFHESFLGLTYDPTYNTLFLSGESDNRIMQFQFISITTSSTLTAGTVSSPYSQSISAQNSQNTVSFAIASGSLPSGLSINSSSGLISGTPTLAGTSIFTVTATDTSSTGTFFDTKQFTLTINSGGGGGGGSSTTDISLTKSASLSNASVGDTLIYTLVATNNGSITASSVTVSDVVPSSLTLTASSTTVGSFTGSTWTIGNMSAGNVATLTLTTLIGASAAGTTVTNTGTATTTSIDSDSSNNSASVNTVVASPGGGGGGGVVVVPPTPTSTSTPTSTPPTIDPPTITPTSTPPVVVPPVVFPPVVNPPPAPICPAKSISTPLIAPLGLASTTPQIVYTLTVSNKGSQTATSVKVSEMLPKDLMYLTSAASLGSYNPASGIWNIGSLAHGQTATLKLTVILNPDSKATAVVNTACVSSGSVDSNFANNSSVAGFTVHAFGGELVPFIPKGFPSTGKANLSQSGYNTNTLKTLNPKPLNIFIKQLSIDAPITEVGLNNQGNIDTPKNPDSVGWFSYGVRPGEVGSAVLDGHLDTTEKGAVFWNLKNIKVGETVSIKSSDGKTSMFRVKEKKLYNYNDTSALAQVFGKNDKAYLNLITCAGNWLKNKNSYSQRLVVFTEKIN